MKKKLLITLGDSFTEGVGCYDYTYPIHDGDKIFRPTEYQLNRFNKFGWPNLLGKKLNYDTVINLGWGGSGHSAHAKLFIEKIIGKDFSEYDVLVIWMLTSSSRFSFYSHGRISQFGPINDDNSQVLIERGYLSILGDVLFDSCLESIFYIKCVEQICENNSFNLLITSWENTSFDEIKKFHNSNYYMKEVNGPVAFLTYGEYKSKICCHPNEKGYEVFSENMFESIQKFNPHLINKSEVLDFTYIYDGIPKNWNNIKFPFT